MNMKRQNLTTIIVTIVILSVVMFLFTACAEKATKGLVYTEKADGTYEISKYEGNVDNIIIPSKYKGKTVTSIGNYAFESWALTTITIPNTVTSIGNSAFADTYLKDIYYKGTKEEWNAITKGKHWNVTFINNTGYTVHCSDGDLSGMREKYF